MTVRQEGVNPNRPRMIRVGAAVSLALLAVQFLLGMITNLYISLPSHSYGGAFAMRAMMSASGGARALFTLHMMLGPLLVIAGFATLVTAGVSRRHRDVVLSTAGLLGILVAGYAGLSFLMGGGGNAASLVMSVGFLAAFSAYFAQLSLTR